MSKNEISRWNIESEEVNFSSRVWELRTRRYHLPGKNISDDFYYISSPDWVVVIARTTDKNILLVRQFRCGIDDFSLELPGGIIDPEEDPISAGIRELNEETGYKGGSSKLLGACFPNPSMLNNKCHFVFIDQSKLSNSGTCWDLHEEIELVLVPQSELIKLVENGKIAHSLTLSALYRFSLLEP